VLGCAAGSRMADSLGKTSACARKLNCARCESAGSLRGRGRRRVSASWPLRTGLGIDFFDAIGSWKEEA